MPGAEKGAKTPSRDNISLQSREYPSQTGRCFILGVYTYTEYIIYNRTNLTECHIAAIKDLTQLPNASRT